MAERGRPRKFDKDAALRSAMQVFWAKGYDHTSLTDLTNAMGIAGPSLYAAFGDKEGLFREALALYQATVGREIWQSLEEQPTIHGAVRSFLLNTARSYAEPDAPAGCMIVLAAPNLEGSPPMGDVLRRMRAVNIDQLRTRFERSVAEGELPPHFDCAGAATYYATLQNGMSILARDGADAATLESVALSGAASLPVIAPLAETHG